jgi:DNA topoisomerase I
VPGQPAEDAVEAARSAGLRYVTDRLPGFRRVKHGSGFVYRDRSGETIREPRELARIKALAIPPAYTDVWICPDPNGHLQSTGRDARGRKQYRYHPRWRETRDETKFERMLDFAAALPRIRRRVRDDLRLTGLPREKVLAAVIRLLDTTRLRVGNQEYVKANKSYGLTTLRNSHAAMHKDSIRFRFRGKGGKFRAINVTDAKLARLVRLCQDLPGHELFQYLDGDGNAQSIDSADVNDYLRAAAGGDFTAKDFRTWHASVECLRAIRRVELDGSPPPAALVKAVLTDVADMLGNTPAICRKSYIHPRLLAEFANGTLPRRTSTGDGRNTISQAERAIVPWLRKHTADACRSRRSS